MEWRAVFRQLVAFGYLAVDPEFGALTLTPASRPVLRGEKQVPMRRQVAAKERGKGKREKVARRAKAAAGIAEADEPLWEALRAWRYATAKERNVAAFVVFPDSTLAEIARVRPRTMDELANITGIGAKKLEAYGEALLEITKDH
jgi:ATP-dependent DNA helicase RecQ